MGLWVYPFIPESHLTEDPGPRLHFVLNGGPVGYVNYCIGLGLPFQV